MKIAEKIGKKCGKYQQKMRKKSVKNAEKTVNFAQYCSQLVLYTHHFFQDDDVTTSRAYGFTQYRNVLPVNIHENVEYGDVARTIESIEFPYFGSFK